MKNWLYIILVPIFFLSCKKDDNSAIPLVTVNTYIHVTDPAYISISVPGGWTYINGGSRGIIIYRISNNAFMAYDRHCPYDASNSCALVSVDVSNIIGLDDCCGSKFLLTDGSVTVGPANLPLKQYSTSYDGSVLRIYN